MDVASQRSDLATVAGVLLASAAAGQRRRGSIRTPARIHGSKWTTVAVVAVHGCAPRARMQHVDSVGYMTAAHLERAGCSWMVGQGEVAVT